MATIQQKIINLLAMADVQVGGSRPWDLQVYNERLFTRLLSEGSLGLGEGYMDGWWDAASIDQLICNLLNHKISSKITPYKLFALKVQSKLTNMQKLTRAFQVGEQHYNTGNHLFETMLDSRLTYTCGYWKDADDLEAAQEAKLDLVCRKIGLKAGQHVLDIGCGWGSFAKFAAKRYGAKVTGITISTEQAAHTKELCENLPINIRVQDYRLLDEQFDHIVSLGMFEHVGVKNYRTYFEVANKCLKDGGLFLLHTIGGIESKSEPDPWVHKYIFPNGLIPSLVNVSKAFEDLFILEDLHNFGAYYDKTLMAWYDNFNNGWDELKSEYDERFYRMWKYYLLACAGAFRARELQLWQMVLSKHGVDGVYQRIT